MSKTHSRNLSFYILRTISQQPMQFARFTARLIARLINAFKISNTAKIIQLNLKIALPHLTQPEYDAITRQTISNEVVSYFEFFSIWGANNKKNIARLDQVQGAEYFHQALETKQGLVLIVPHFGTWEVMNAWCAQFTDMTILYKPIKNKDADLFVRDARSRERATLVPTDESGVRQIFKALKKGGTTVILPDHTPDAGGEMVDYFGIPLPSSSLSAKLIQKTKAAALFLYAKRNNNGGFDMTIEPIDEKIYSTDTVGGTLIIHHAIEDLIQRYPEHYHWSYKRFSANDALNKIYDIPEDEALAKVNQLRATLALERGQP